MPGTVAALIPTIGRPTLARTIQSASWADEIIVVRDPEPTGDAARVVDIRDQQIQMATADWLSFMDDDDCYTDDAGEIIRESVGEDRGRWHIFRMKMYDGGELWFNQEVRWANLGTPMMVIPNRPDLPKWSANRVYEADFRFANAMKQQFGEPIWHEDFIALIRPHEMKESMYELFRHRAEHRS